MEPQPIGQTYAVSRYRTNQQPSMPDTMPGRLLKRQPLITPEEFPAQTMCRIFKCGNLEDSLDYDVMKGHLLSYYKHGQKWEDYRVKIAPPLLEIWKCVMIECRRNGFVNPHIRDREIVFDQVVSSGPRDSTLCTMCDRDCKRRAAIDSGDAKRRKMIDPKYQEQRPCWDHRQPGEEG